MKSRREFIRDAGILAASLLVAPKLVNALGGPKKNIGIQLYTLRDIIGKDVQGTIQKIAQAGFKEVETYGYDAKSGFWKYSALDFKRLLDDNGLVSPSGHFAFEDFIDNGDIEVIKPFVEAANVLGSKYVVLPWLSEKNRKNVDDYKRVAEKLNLAGEYCKKQGLTVAYHNHGFEFTKFQDKTGLDILLQETDKKLVHFELDLYWTEFAGYNPTELFEQYPHRFKMWHVKDMDKKNKNWNTEIGNGKIDFKAIFTKAKLSGVKHIYLEQETNYQPNHIASINKSIHFIKDSLLKK